MSNRPAISKRIPAIGTIAVGSDRAAKIMAVRASIARIAQVDAAWRDASVVARSVKTNAPAMPLTDWELMQGARERAYTAVAEVDWPGKVYRHDIGRRLLELDRSGVTGP